MTWRKLDTEEQWQFRTSDVRPAGMVWAKSPSKVLVEVSDGSPEHELLESMHDLLKVAVLICDSPDLHPCALADWYVKYHATSKLVRVMEASEEATGYVLELPEYEDTSGSDSFAYVRHAHDLARSIVARRAALDALRELE